MIFEERTNYFHEQLFLMLYILERSTIKYIHENYTSKHQIYLKHLTVASLYF